MSLSVTSFLILLEVVRSSDLLAVVPARLLRDAPGLCALEPPLEIPGFTKVLAWHERTHHDPAHAWLREQCYALVEEAGADSVR